MMDEPILGMLSDLEARVLGCLMEKQMTTPDYYPLTLKALTTACNQKSSRKPVMDLSFSEVGGIVNDLRSRGLVTARMDGRADRFEHHLARKLKLSGKEKAVLCALMLRGMQTLNEIRLHTSRMTDFDNVADAQQTVDGMIERGLLVKIPRAAGQREERYAHLLCGKPDTVVTAEHTTRLTEHNKQDARIAALETEVATLKADVARLLSLLDHGTSE